NRRGKTIQIVGIVADGKYLTISEAQQAAVFFPISQSPSSQTALLVRPRAEAGDLAATVRRVVREMDPSIPIRESTSLNSALALAFFPAQVATVALGTFGAFGLLLSIAG